MLREEKKYGMIHHMDIFLKVLTFVAAGAVGVSLGMLIGSQHDASSSTNTINSNPLPAKKSPLHSQSEYKLLLQVSHAAPNSPSSSRSINLQCDDALSICPKHLGKNVLELQQHPYPGPNEACTQQFGGPGQATLQGTVGKHKIDLVFNQSNGCEIDKWNEIVVPIQKKVVRD